MGGRALPHARGARAPRDRRQVERRLRRDGHADAAARTCSAASPPTRATRCSSAPTCPSSASPPARCATTTTARSTSSGRTSAAAPRCRRTRTRVLLNGWCMAACYSADEDGTIRLPFDIDTGELIPEVWERWLAWDPVRMVPKHADALRGMRAIYIDAGKRDEWFLDLGAEAFRRELDEARRHRRAFRALRRQRTAASSTATRSRCATWPSGSRPDGPWLLLFLPL